MTDLKLFSFSVALPTDIHLSYLLSMVMIQNTHSVYCLLFPKCVMEHRVLCRMLLDSAY